MMYRGYDVQEENNSIIINGVKDFNLYNTFECGQCFRWSGNIDGSYSGVAKGRAVRLHMTGDRLLIENCTLDDFKNIWFDYFDLGRDYSDLIKMISKDDIMKKAVGFGKGIRLLRQDIWEVLISFIISANNRIPMIKKVVAAISEILGDSIGFDGETFFAFPGVQDLAGSSADEISICKAGFRCKYIIEASRMVLNGDVDLGKLKDMDTADARNELCKLPGVGHKVADCTLLFSGAHYNVFPTDVWVKRVMEELYFNREASFREIQEFSVRYFGDLAGFAQQYLFFYARENKIGIR